MLHSHTGRLRRTPSLHHPLCPCPLRLHDDTCERREASHLHWLGWWGVEGGPTPSTRELSQSGRWRRLLHATRYIYTAPPTHSLYTHTHTPPHTHSTGQHHVSTLQLRRGCSHLPTQCTPWLRPPSAARDSTQQQWQRQLGVCVRLAGRWPEGSSSTPHLAVKRSLPHTPLLHVHVHATCAAHDGAGVSAERSPRVVRGAGSRGLERVGGDWHERRLVV